MSRNVFSFESRAIPAPSLDAAYNHMRFTELPVGWSVRVSEVAPGLGYPGGTTQMQIINHEGTIANHARSH